ncbi:3-deoxy-7-phosphoheptulonate synthase [Alicyclobacillus cellulosilyticus]|uniref:3-deoxy-7-phosphoheptulonate synthase n=1 Tax=Alicyclobacillus cellulosilyticus TaxID=1003997 RepID=A0A917NFA7_9BACL|nr:3-deoxy-7-phosphoheptulonate synthase [Alicyclobacillus cellulosilyticus]GGI95354.1 3-deoxy-7-phosphoheptulonate synthase [Alicyclobacillus cellulosilyticus]
MVITMKKQATKDQIDHVVKEAQACGLSAHLARDGERTVIGLIGEKAQLAARDWRSLPGVEDAQPAQHPFKLASRQYHPESTVIRVGDIEIGGGEPVIIAGPCAVESREQILEAAHQVKAAGAHMLRGGAFKPRSSPYSFQGLAEEGLKLLAEARRQTGLKIVSEVMDPINLPMVCEYVDVLQVGARNMQNFHLLKEIGKTNKPVLLKRGMSATIEEWLMSAEYILSAGNPNVILCERGIRTFEPYTRNTLDLNAVPVVKDLSHLPVIVDPSHGIGIAKYVPAMSLAALAAGADGLIIEVHPRPEEAVSDGKQSLNPAMFRELMSQIRPRSRMLYAARG